MSSIIEYSFETDRSVSRGRRVYTPSNNAQSIRKRWATGKPLLRALYIYPRALSLEPARQPTSGMIKFESIVSREARKSITNRENFFVYIQLKLGIRPVRISGLRIVHTSPLIWYGAGGYSLACKTPPKGIPYVGTKSHTSVTKDGRLFIKGHTLLFVIEPSVLLIPTDVRVPFIIPIDFVIINGLWREMNSRTNTVCVPKDLTHVE